jgi:hypothetical protein
MLFALLASAVLLVLRPALRSLSLHSWPAPKTLPNSTVQCPAGKATLVMATRRADIETRAQASTVPSDLRQREERKIYRKQLYTPLPWTRRHRTSRSGASPICACRPRYRKDMTFHMTAPRPATLSKRRPPNHPFPTPQSIESLKRRFTGAAHGAAALRLLVSAELLDFASKSNLRSICIYYEFHESPSSVVACRSTPIHSPESPAFAPLHRHATQRGRNQCQSHASRDTLHMGWLRTHCKC